MPCSIVLGANGQDGSYVAETLLARGHRVVGLGRDAQARHIAPSAQYRYVQCDLRDTAALNRLLSEVKPDFAFHFAAVHGSAGFQYEPLVADMFATNVVALHSLLEYARCANDRLRIVYAGSSKIFPSPLTGRIDETTLARATCLYSIGKIAARDLITRYRLDHSIAATNLILFNHESPRRPASFLLPKIAQGILDALADPRRKLTVRTLDFWIDWAAADELAELAVDIAMQLDGHGAEEGEFVLASGTTHHAREVIHDLFARYGLDGESRIVEELPRSDPGPAYHVSLDRLERLLGRRPVKTVAHIVEDMIGAPAARAHDRVN
tara:strand:- start:3665 stop:4636 length:972 start_codon:yes stop_codon:yes gene_type:complete